MKRKKGLLTELLFLLLCVVIACFLMPRLCQNLAFSFFYRPPSSSISLNEIEKANTLRTQRAQEYLSEHNFKHLFDYSFLNHTHFCFVILTSIRRTKPHYITQTTARLVQQLEDISNYTFSVYNAGGTAHTEARELSLHVPVYAERITKPYLKRNEYDREKQDYVSALKWCLRKNSTYNIVLQDDAFPDKSFAGKLDFILRLSLRDGEGKSWGLMKLFYPEKYQGWGDHPSYVGELMVIVLVLSLLLFLLTSLILPGPINWYNWTVNRAVFYWRILISVSLVLFLVLSLGRAHWEELRKLSPYFLSIVEARGCCIPAVLYPHSHLQSLVAFLDSIHCNNTLPVDLAIDEWVEKENLRKLLAVPNLFNHIGFISSLSKGTKNLKEFHLLFPPT